MNRGIHSLYLCIKSHGDVNEFIAFFPYEFARYRCWAGSYFIVMDAPLRVGVGSDKLIN